MSEPATEDDSFAAQVLRWLKVNGQTLEALGPHPTWFWFVLGCAVTRSVSGHAPPLTIEAALELVAITKKFKPKEPQ